MPYTSGTALVVLAGSAPSAPATDSYWVNAECTAFGGDVSRLSRRTVSRDEALTPRAKRRHKSQGRACTRLPPCLFPVMSAAHAVPAIGVDRCSQSGGAGHDGGMLKDGVIGNNSTFLPGSRAA
jgi:hypothetical protein